jgi:hypothetical protein
MQCLKAKQKALICGTGINLIITLSKRKCCDWLWTNAKIKIKSSMMAAIELFVGETKDHSPQGK